MEGKKLESVANHPTPIAGQWYNPFNSVSVDYVPVAQPKCQSFYMDFLKCTSRTGLQNAQSKCPEQFDDLQECVLNRKRLMRNRFIMAERLRQGRAPLKPLPGYAEQYGDYDVNTEDMKDNLY